jgi:alanyl-tRNA synthetase
VESLQAELAAARRELADVRWRRLNALRARCGVQAVGSVSVLALDVPSVDVETLRALADKFRERYPLGGAAILASGTLLIAVVTEDLVKRGLIAGELIAAIGGRGGGRPNLAQGSLPDGTKVSEALAKTNAAIKAKLK